MPRGNQRGYKGMSGYKGGAKIFDSFVKAGLTVAFGKPKKRSRKAPVKYSNNTPQNSGCLVILTLIFMVNLLIIIVVL
ncbi:hypothetical protein SDC9_20252 [bioreactor metagenome]|uniref:Uncharacterized protein n=1 Tax=bioreactor metagenome TaxID=1076179 RepID=A0A644U607_9ZZZZ